MVKLHVNYTGDPSFLAGNITCKRHKLYIPTFSETATEGTALLSVCMCGTGGGGGGSCSYMSLPFTCSGFHSYILYIFLYFSVAKYVSSTVRAKRQTELFYLAYPLTLTLFSPLNCGWVLR